MPIRFSIMYAVFAMFTVAMPSARALDQTCHTSSDYDLTVTDAALQFERKNASGRRLEMRKGALAVNSQAVALGAGDRQRVAAFESRVRELVPKVKTIAQRGVDLMVVAVREEAVSASPGSAANRQVNARVDARAQELKTKIARSVTSKEWHAEALQGYMAVLLSDVAPLIAGDLAQQAVDRTLKGDLAGVVALRDRAIALRASLETRIRDKLELLQPDIAKLCPSLRELDRLETGMTQGLPDGTRLNLIKVDS
jgi:urease beta subunit